MKDFKILKWIFLGLATLSNGFVLAYSAIPSKKTEKWTKSFTTSFAKVFNKMSERQVEDIKMESLSCYISPKESYKYNYISGYEANEIPIGSAKQIESSFMPENTTNSSLVYYTDNPDLVTLNQSGNVLSVVGMKTGTATIHAKNNDSELDSSCVVSIVETVEPVAFELTLENTTIPLNSQATLSVIINSETFGSDELINFRYYDSRKLSYSSGDNDILTVDEYGVIHPKSYGTTKVTVSNSNGFSRSLFVTVSGTTILPAYSDLKIFGSNVCYGNDMINDQNSQENHTILEIFDGEQKLNNEDFIWESSNELLLKVDKYGVARGFRKCSVDDENVKIRARSKINNQYVEFDMVVKEQLPTSIYYSVVNGTDITWNPESYTACVGDVLEIRIGFRPSISKKQIEIQNADPDAIDITNQNATIVLSLKKTGDYEIVFISEVNPNLSGKIMFTILKAGAIKTEELSDVGHSLRKIIGHASLFAIAQIFTLISFIMFFCKEPIWKNASFSMLIGLLVSILSELIQLFTPGRTWSLLDVFINFSGIIFGAVCVIIVISLVEFIKLRRQNKSIK